VPLQVIFVGLNAPWGIVPPLLLLQSLWKINAAVGTVQKQEEQAKTMKKAPKAASIAASVTATQEKKKGK